MIRNFIFLKIRIISQHMIVCELRHDTKAMHHSVTIYATTTLCVQFDKWIDKMNWYNLSLRIYLCISTLAIGWSDRDQLLLKCYLQMHLCHKTPSHQQPSCWWNNLASVLDIKQLYYVSYWNDNSMNPRQNDSNFGNTILDCLCHV